MWQYIESYERYKKTTHLIVFLIGVNIYAYDIVANNSDGVTIYYDFINNNKELEIAYCWSAHYYGHLDIPEEVTYMNKTYKVTSIGEYSLSQKEFISVSIPNTVTQICNCAFFYSKNLKEITIPESVRSIMGGAFDGCKGLTSVTILNSMTVLGSGVFEDCTSLISINLPNSIKEIPSFTFLNCI